MNATTKVCGGCKKEKPATTEYFSRYKGKRDGFRSQCRECRKAYMKAWHASPKGKAYDKAYSASPARKAYQKTYNKAYSASPARKAYEKAYNASPARKAYMKAWNASPARKAYMKAYNASPAKNTHMKAWREKHAPRFRAYFHRVTKPLLIAIDQSLCTTFEVMPPKMRAQFAYELIHMKYNNDVAAAVRMLGCRVEDDIALYEEQFPK